MMIRPEQNLRGEWGVVRYTPFGPVGRKPGGWTRNIEASGLSESEAHRRASDLNEEERREALRSATTPRLRQPRP